MGLVRLVLRRPVSVLIVVAGLLVFGVMSVFSLPMELTPEMEMPMLVVNTIYPNAAPQDVEKLVTHEIEGVAASLNGIDSIISRSSESVSLVMLSYEYGTNMNIAYTDLMEKLNMLSNILPENSTTPIIIAIDMNDLNANMTISVSSESTDDLLYLIEEEIVPAFEKLPSVADVSVSGGREQYIRVELLEEKLQQYGVSREMIIASVSGADFSIPAGIADYGSRSMPVRGQFEINTVEDLQKIAIPLPGGAVIRLSDVANVYEATRDADSLSRYNGNENISLGISKRQSANVTQVSDEVREAVRELSSRNEEISITVVQDASEMVTSSLSSVATALLLGILISMIVLFLFFGDVRASLIVGCAMPISLLVTFILMRFMGFSLNLITMSALILGIGMMVDNSIVVLDSCFKSVTERASLVDAALKGAKFVISAVAGSTITTVVVFLPLAMIPGMSGQIFGPLGFTIIFALTASLVSAMTLVPLLFTQYHPRENANAPAAKPLIRLEKSYAKLLKILLRRKITGLLAAVALLLGSIGLATQINVELMPAIDEGVILVEAEMRPGVRLENVSSLMGELEKLAASYPDVESYSLSAGGSANLMGGGSGNTASMYLYLLDDRAMSTEEIISSLREAVRDFLDCEINISSSGANQSGSTMSNDVEINLKGNHLDDLKEAAKTIVQIMENRTDIVRVSSTAEDSDPQMEIVVDPLAAAGYGFTPMQILGDVRTALSGQETVGLRKDDKEYEIWVEYPPGKYQNMEDLTDMRLVSPSGAVVPLASLAHLDFADAPQSISRDNNEYIVTVSGTPTAAAKFTAAGDIRAVVETIDFPDGVALAQSSMEQMQTEEFSSLGMAIAVAALLVFMVMAIQFESPKLSLMVMLCVPFSLIGSLTLLFVSGVSLSMSSILGFLVLVGTVVNNGILFVSTTNQYCEEMPVVEAIFKAARTRLRPILMTTLTTTLAIVPMALGIGRGTEMMQGLGIVVIGGLTASTLLSLLLLPIFYLLMKGQRKRRSERGNAEKPRVIETED
ncbi:MAG: efflux RND transporter permease subunit [Clostridiales Family XIII bacterium]|jgi:multidrug efflux pump subunit AcrB|nr:efflux RND transporter permease subunit [Clostridiales Family XIII bacterium]